MNMRLVAGWTGVGLIIIGVLLIVAQLIWPDAFPSQPREVGFMGANLKTTVVGLVVVLIGAVLLAVSALGRRISN